MSAAGFFAKAISCCKLFAMFKNQRICPKAEAINRQAHSCSFHTLEALFESLKVKTLVKMISS